jgi:hypothetical protein
LKGRAPFAGHRRRTLTRQELLAMAWGMTFDPGTNLVDVYGGYLRRKPGETVIETVRGPGTACAPTAGQHGALSLGQTATQPWRPDRDTSHDTHNAHPGAGRG